MAHVIGDVRDTSPSFKQVDSERMSKRVDSAGVESSFGCIRVKEIWHPVFLQCALASGTPGGGDVQPVPPRPFLWWGVRPT